VPDGLLLVPDGQQLMPDEQQLVPDGPLFSSHIKLMDESHQSSDLLVLNDELEIHNGLEA